MSKMFWQRVFSVLLFSGMVLSSISPMAAQAATQSVPESKSPTKQAGGNFDVSQPVTPKISLAVRDLPKSQDQKGQPVEPRALKGIPETQGTDTKIQDPLAAHGLNLGDTPDPLFTFEGTGNLNQYTPPDTNGDVGPNDYVQTVNVKLTIFDKTGVVTTGPVDINTLWSGFGGPCQTDNDGDPIVLYDDMADRWMISQFAVTTGQEQCIAVSTTPDPAGTYYLYDFPMPDFPDYPKFGVWPDGYYMGTNTGFPNQYYAHVFDRVSMLAGLPATRQSFSGYANLLMPADADGTMPPPAGAPEYFYTYYSDGYPNHPPGVDRLAIYEFDVDWATPANSTFTLATEIPIAPYNYTVCGFFGPDCIPEPAPGVGLDSLSWWPMVRLQYRNFGTYEAMVSNFTVDLDGTDKAAIRWFEVRKIAANPWSLFQEGTYAPDSSHRWMGSIAMDGSGNIALGYSVSDSTVTKPSIRYAVHEYTDAPGTMQAEATIIDGNGVNTGPYGRWGDYSAMSVDPSDQCTFWYTNEYHDVNESSFLWNTRVGVFKVPACTGSLGATGTLAGNVTSSVGGTPIDGAIIQATASITQTGIAATNASGDYSMLLPVANDYTATASKFGYLPSTVTNVDIFSGTTTTQDFILDPAPAALLDGTVTDINTGWPLYAKVTVGGSPYELWTDPVTGYFSVMVPEGMTYTLSVEAFSPGYFPASADVFVSTDTTQDFQLDVDTVACIAPGYQYSYDWYENFEGGDGGFTVSGATTTWEWGTPTSGPGAAHSGTGAWATNLAGDYLNSENGYITSPNIDLSSFTGATFVVQWFQWANTESGYDYISIEASNDGGTTWNVVYGPLSGTIDTNGWAAKQIVLNSTYAVANAQLRFHFTSDGSVTRPGWYVDDIGISAAYPPAPTIVYNEDFNATDGAYTHSGTNDSWEWGVPGTAFPGGCMSGNCWDTNLAGNYANSSNFSLVSPLIDLSAVVLPPGSLLYLKWAQAIHIESATWDHAYAQTSINGGPYTTQWTNPVGTIQENWADKGPYEISSAAGGNIQLQYQLTSDSSVNYEGWTVDNVQIYYAQPWTPSIACNPPTDGGLVVGNVYDANTMAALTGAAVANDSGNSASAVATPDDPAVDDAFYTIFSPSGMHVFTSTMSGYAPYTADVTVVQSDTVGYDFYMPAGWLTYEPPTLEATLPLGASATQPLTLTNNGASPVNFDLQEVPGGFINTRLPQENPSEPYSPPSVSSPALGLSDFAEANVSGTSAPMVTNAVILDQAPNQSNGLFADSGCALCTTGQQSIAENFMLTGPASIGQIVFWTGYYPGDVPLATDTITVIFHQDSAGSPGSAIYTEADVSYTRQQTGVTLFGVHEWMHTLTLATSVNLNAGNYWVEIFNDTSSSSDDFFWETGNLDPAAGLVGSGWATSTPGAAWNYDGATELAVQLLTGGGGGNDVPWLSENPISGTLSGVQPPLANLVTTSSGGDTSRSPAVIDRSLYADSGKLSQESPQAFLQDPSFEAGSPNPYWGEYSLNFGTPLCDAASCGTGGGTAGPNTGAWWAWFGGIGATEVGILTQTVTLASNAESLGFYLWVGAFGGNTSDVFRVLVDGTPLYTYNISAVTPGYARVDIDITAYADGGSHVIRLDAQTYDSTNISVDDVQIVNASMQTIDVTFDASVVNQPGIYYAQLQINNDTPYGPETVPVTMTVTAPPSYGKLEGTVTGLGYCDTNPGPLDGADVTIESGMGMTWTVSTDPSGHYQIWLDEMYSPVTVTVTAVEHAPGLATGVAISGQMTTTQDFDLRWLEPCVSTNPDMYNVQVALGYSLTQPLSIINAGAADSNFNISEQAGIRVSSPKINADNGTITWLYRNTEGIPVSSPTDNGVTMAYPGAYRYQPDKPTTAMSILVYTDDWIHTTPNTLVQQALAILGYPATVHVDGDYAGFLTDLTTGGPWDVVVWSGENYTADAATLPDLLAYVQGGGKLIATYWRQAVDVQYDPLWTAMGMQVISNYIVPPPAYWWKPGHPMFNDPESAPEWINRVQNSGTSQGTNLEPLGNGVAMAGYATVPTTNEAGIILRNDDQTLYKGLRDVSTDADDDGDTILDGTELWVNMIFGMVNGFGTDVPWITEAPITGTVSADSAFNVDVTFTAMPTLTIGTAYTATLKVSSDDPMMPDSYVPVTMTVVAPSYGVSLPPDEVEWGLPGQTMTYTVMLTNTSNGPTDSFTLTLGAFNYLTTMDHYTVGPLAPGESAMMHIWVTIPDDALEGEHDSVQLTATSMGDPGVSGSMTMSTYVSALAGVQLSPDTDAKGGMANDMIQYTLHVTNTSNTTDTFTLSSSGTWSVSIPTMVYTLGVGEGTDVMVYVIIPATAMAGDSDVTTITVAGALGSSDDSTLTTSAIVNRMLLPVIR